MFSILEISYVFVICFAVQTIERGAHGASLKVKCELSGRNFGSSVFWRHRDNAWAPCTRSCDTGVTHALLGCYETALSSYVDESRCACEKKPLIKKVCNTQPCVKSPPNYWYVTSWGACSTTCGPGLKSRVVACVKYDESAMIDDSQCNEEKPKDHVSCQVRACPHDEGVWQTTQWSQCSKSCGIGIQTRQVACVFPNGTHTTGRDCWLSRPKEVQTCGKVCAKWIAGSWGKCKYNKKKVSCNAARQKRCVVCVDVETIESSDKCDHDEKPTTYQRCRHEDCRGFL